MRVTQGTTFAPVSLRDAREPRHGGGRHAEEAARTARRAGRSPGRAGSKRGGPRAACCGSRRARPPARETCALVAEAPAAVREQPVELARSSGRNRCATASTLQREARAAGVQADEVRHEQDRAARRAARAGAPGPRRGSGAGCAPPAPTTAGACSTRLRVTARKCARASRSRAARIHVREALRQVDARHAPPLRDQPEERAGRARCPTRRCAPSGRKCSSQRKPMASLRHRGGGEAPSGVL